MIWLLIAILAQLILGTSAVFDKLLLRRKFFDPLVYTFWIGIFGLTAFMLVPFGFAVLPSSLLIFALSTGAVFIGGLFLLFYALNKGEASTIFTLVGGVSPIATFLFADLFLGSRLTGGDLVGFLLLIAGAFILFFVEKKELRFSVVMIALLSASLFGLYGVFAKIIFEATSFITGFLWIKSGAAISVIMLLVIPRVREKIREMSYESNASHRTLYVSNMAYAGIGSALFNIALSLAHPALVDATQSFKYIVIFIGAWLLLKECASGKVLAGKIVATLLIILGLVWLGIAGYARSIPVNPDRPITWGVTFSSKYSKELGLDWRTNYEAILNELHPKKIRIIAYWDEIEGTRGAYDFSDLDWEMDEAARAQIPVILTVGMRVPRWPECFIPKWAVGLPTENRERALREYLPKVIERYQNHPALETWQLENEPFLRFGKCPRRGVQFLEKELTIVKSVDTTHPVLVSDSGEFGYWYKAVKSGDIFGTTMYRKVYPPSIGWLVGIVQYPIDPSFFRLREKISRFFTGEKDKKFVVIELQGEPWGNVEIPLLSYAEQTSIFPPEYFHETIEYAKQTGFDEYYLWGAEWWWFVKEKHGDGRYWEIAKTLLK